MGGALSWAHPQAADRSCRADDAIPARDKASSESVAHRSCSMPSPHHVSSLHACVFGEIALHIQSFRMLRSRFEQTAEHSARRHGSGHARGRDLHRFRNQRSRRNRFRNLSSEKRMRATWGGLNCNNSYHAIWIGFEAARILRYSRRDVSSSRCNVLNECRELTI